MTKMTVLVCLTFLGTSASALAGGGAKGELKAGIDKVKTACKDDINSHCSDINPGDGRLAACLKSKEDLLSSGCNDARKGLREMVSAKMDKAELEVRKSCGSDIQKFCGDVPSGQGRLYSCLNEHTESLSDSCNALQAKIDDRLRKTLG